MLNLPKNGILKMLNKNSKFDLSSKVKIPNEHHFKKFHSILEQNSDLVFRLDKRKEWFVY